MIARESNVRESRECCMTSVLRLSVNLFDVQKFLDRSVSVFPTDL